MSTDPRRTGGVECTFTVFTPTFNRAHTLHRVYESLAAQTFRDFEWLIVDDGSTDDTARLVEQWMRSARMTIRYIRQENRGKHVAHNVAVNAARGELFLTLDSDDACLPHALDHLASHWRAIPDSERERYSAVTVLCADTSGQIIGDPFPLDVFDGNLAELSYRHKVRGEKWGFQRTDILREQLFDAEANRGCVPEGLVWHRIGERYRMRFVNEVLRIYHRDGPSLSRGRSADQDAYGRRMYYEHVLNRDLRYFPSAPVLLEKAARQYIQCSLHLGLSLREQFRSIRVPARVLCGVVLPFAAALWVHDRRVG